MDAAYVSAFAAPAGSALGGLTSLAASWMTQRVQFHAHQLAHDIARREELYKEFIEQASQCYADAVEHSDADVAKLVRLSAVVSRMRILSSARVVERADTIMRLIIETYGAPNQTIHEVADNVTTGQLDPLRDFSEVCRDELRAGVVIPPLP